MFYSHEILTSHKYGIATIWLVATLGSKSGLRKVTRKAIQKVNIEKACETVAEPDAPMALRLQGSLLYGISRVYGKRCDYVLVDAQHTQTSLLTAWKAIRDAQLDPNAGQVKCGNSKTLIIRDDPGFIPNDLVPLLDIDLAMFESSQIASSMPSVLSGHGQISSASDGSPLGIIIPSSDTPKPGGSILPGGSSDQAGGYHPLLSFEEDELNLDLGFEFDDEGRIVDTAASPDKPTAAELAVGPRVRSNSQASAQIRQDIEDGLRAGEEMRGEVVFPQFDDRGQALPAAEPFPSTHRTAVDEKANDPDYQPEQDAQAGHRKKRRLARSIPLDTSLQLRNATLTLWNTTYLSNMAAARAQKLKHKLPSQARKNAAHYILGRGLGDTGLSRAALKSPLADIFSGPHLYRLLTGHKLETRKDRKRSSSRSASPEPSPKRARAERAEGVEDPGEVEQLRAAQDTGLALEGDDSIELPRDAPGLLEDHSSTMPWNIASSSRAGSKAGSKPGSRAGSRPPSSLRATAVQHAPETLPSARHSPGGLSSPSAGVPGFGMDMSLLWSSPPAGSAGRAEEAGRVEQAGRAEQSQNADSKDAAAPGLRDEAMAALLQGASTHEIDRMVWEGQGLRASQVEAHISSQAAREALIAETARFLEFVVLHAKAVAEGEWNEGLLGDGQGVLRLGEGGQQVTNWTEDSEADSGDIVQETPLEQEIQAPAVTKATTLETLIPPGQHTRNVAAQAFLHVLSLATRGVLRVVQEIVGGDIGIGVVEGGEVVGGG